jgi:hypothetical protein
MPVSTIQNASLASGVPGKANLPTGSVLQVVSANYAVETSTTSTSWSDTGITATITPTSVSSKILILISNPAFTYAATTSAGGQFQILRGATSIYNTGLNSLYINATGASAVQNNSQQGINYLDSPATTSATTYKLQQQSYFSGRQFGSQVNSATSTITLMEIAA